MDKRDYYTYIGIVLGLRREYRNKHDKLFYEKGISIELNPFQQFSLDKNMVQLITKIKLGKKRYISINYNAELDQIEIRRNCWHYIDEYTFLKLIDTKIPRSILPEAFLRILDNNIDSRKTVFLNSVYPEVVDGNYEIKSNKKLVKKDVYF